MKLLLVTIFLAVVVTFVSPHTAATYNDTVSGSQTASAESGSVAFNLDATGELPGMLSVKVQHEAVLSTAVVGP
jgi:hypothetical protein